METRRNPVREITMHISDQLILLQNGNPSRIGRSLTNLLSWQCPGQCFSEVGLNIQMKRLGLTRVRAFVCSQEVLAAMELARHVGARFYHAYNCIEHSSLPGGGQKCGACYELMYSDDPKWCKPGSVVLTATNFCPPNWNS